MRRTALLIAALLLLPACGEDDGKRAVRASSGPSVPMPTGTPSPEPGTGAKPTQLVVADLVEGTGGTALPGKTLTVKYVGYLWDGKVFDSNFGPGGHPLPFNLGEGRVIPGWDQGLIGMKVGGRRKLVIPPQLGYGEFGAGPGSPIGPNETLTFVVDLISVSAGADVDNTFAPQ